MTCDEIVFPDVMLRVYLNHVSSCIFYSDWNTFRFFELFYFLADNTNLGETKTKQNLVTTDSLSPCLGFHHFMHICMLLLVSNSISWKFYLWSSYHNWRIFRQLFKVPSWGMQFKKKENEWFLLIVCEDVRLATGYWMLAAVVKLMDVFVVLF